MRTLNSLISSVSLLALAACSQPTVPPMTGNPVTVTQSSSVVADSQQDGTKSAVIAIGTPQESAFGGAKGFELLAVQHRWVVDDIFQYTANLKFWDGQGFVDFATPLNTVVPRKGAEPKTMAVFTNLKQGSMYRVQLTAEGDIGGTAASTILNADTTTSALFDFSASQDVEDTLSTTMTVVLDQTPFSGTGTSTVGTPDDGTFQNTTEPEAGTAQ